MMAPRFTALACLALAATLVGHALAIELIELTDANQAILNLEISKSLGGVQNAYRSGFRFDTVQQIRKFLDQCKYLGSSISTFEDSALNGMAKQIKEIVAEPSIKLACSASSHQLTENEVDQLDDLSKGDSILPHLSTNVLNLLVSLNAKVKEDPKLNAVLGHLLKARIDEVTEGLLNGAPNDIEIMIGETQPSRGWFDFETRYHKICEITLIAPICKLVRGSPLEVSIISADVNKFTQAIKSNDTAQLAEHTESSGVTMEELKDNCDKLKRHLRPIEQINKYLSAGLLNSEQYAAHRQASPNLDNYASLFDLCQSIL